MAILRDSRAPNHAVDYMTSIALLACATCLIVMLKFGFKASINFYARKKNEDDELMAGAYRVNRNEFFDSEGVAEPRKNLTPSMVQLPPSDKSSSPLRPTKSTSDLTVKNNLSVELNKSTNDVSTNPGGGLATTSNRNTTIVDERKLNVNKVNKEQSKLEKKRLAEQKAREKKEEEKRAKELTKQEKLRKKREKEQAREQAKVEKDKKKKRQAPQPQAAASLAKPTTSSTTNNLRTANPIPSEQIPSTRSQKTQSHSSNALPTNQAPYSTNTLQSSISRSSGPPPYSEITTSLENTNSGSDVSFGKPIEEPSNSWDLISQHRQQMSRPTGQALNKVPKKNMVMDLQYKLGNNDNTEV